MAIGPNAASFELQVRGPYDFERSVRDHGWIALSPCRWLKEQSALQRVERLDSGRVVLIQATSASSSEDVRLSVDVVADGSLTDIELTEIERKVRWMLRLDEDLSEFYQLCSGEDGLWQRVKTGRGRLLRSPELFEDVVKTIATTNTIWSQTVGMVDRLVKTLGDPFPLAPTLRAFPTPAQVAAATEQVLREQVRLGYRSAYVFELARSIAEGVRNLESLKDSRLTAKELKRGLKSIKGVGDYSASTLLMLLGRYEELAIDSEMRSFVARRYFEGRPATDTQIRAIYDRWGKWKYLMYWFEVA